MTILYPGTQDPVCQNRAYHERVLVKREMLGVRTVLEGRIVVDLQKCFRSQTLKIFVSVGI